MISQMQAEVDPKPENALYMNGSITDNLHVQIAAIVQLTINTIWFETGENQSSQWLLVVAHEFFVLTAGQCWEALHCDSIMASGTIIYTGKALTQV